MIRILIYLCKAERISAIFNFFQNLINQKRIIQLKLFIDYYELNSLVTFHSGT